MFESKQTQTQLTHRFPSAPSKFVVLWWKKTFTYQPGMDRDNRLDLWQSKIKLSSLSEPKLQ